MEFLLQEEQAMSQDQSTVEKTNIELILHNGLLFFELSRKILKE